MKFYDNEMKEHDTRIGAAFGSLINKIDSALEKHFPGYNLFPEDPVVDVDYRECEDEEFDDDFYDPEEDEKEEEVVNENSEHFTSKDDRNNNADSNISIKFDKSTKTITMLDKDGNIIKEVVITDSFSVLDFFNEYIDENNENETLSK